MLTATDIAFAVLAIISTHLPTGVRTFLLALAVVDDLVAVTWALVRASGVHATVAGVLLGVTVPVIRCQAAGGPDTGSGTRRPLC